MQKFKTLILATILSAFTLPSMAGIFDSYDAQESGHYNRVGISYINNTIYCNKDAYIEDIEDGDTDDYMGLNGFGISYTHGFPISQRYPMFIEVGGGFNFLFRNLSDKDHGYKQALNTSLITLEVPVNYVYRFNVGSDWTIAPYAGLNFRAHLMFKDKIKISGGNSSINYNYDNFKKNGAFYGLTGHAYNRCTLGWQIGVGAQYKPLYFGLSYGTDFLRFYSYQGVHALEGTFKINVGFTF